MKLYDDLLRGRVVPFDLRFPDRARDLSADVASAVHIDIDNVTRYYFESSPEDHWSLKDSFINLAPSFDRIIWTTPAPHYANANGKHEVWNTHLAGFAWAWLQTVSPVENVDEAHAFWREITGNFGRTQAQALIDEPGWFFMYELFMQMPLKGVVGPSCVTYTAVQRSGAVCTMTNSESAVVIAVTTSDLNPQEYFRHCALSSYLFPVALAQSFLHCKNVVLEEGRIPRQQQRASARQGAPLQRFYTIEIEPMKQVLRTEGRSAKVGLHKALHICRGHFATYSSERPLFGKYAGTFWVPAHVRGTDEAGKVFKDYAIKASA